MGCFYYGYAENLDQIRFADKGVGSAISLLDQDKALDLLDWLAKLMLLKQSFERFGKAWY